MTVTLVVEIKGAPAGDEYTEARQFADKAIKLVDATAHAELSSVVIK